MAGSLSVVVPVVIESFVEGRVRMAPLAARSLMTHGEDGDARSELAAFLTERLAEASPAEITRLAAHGMEGHHALRMVSVAISLMPPEREERRDAGVPVDFACVVLAPHARCLERTLSASAPETPSSTEARAARPALPSPLGETWIAIPVLDHVFRLPDDVPLDSDPSIDGAIAHEILRLVAATSESPLDVVAFLPPTSTRIERLVLQVLRPEQRGASVTTGLHEAERQRREAQLRLLEQMGRRLSSTAAPPLRDESIAELTRLLTSSERLGVLVRGPELGGKSAVLAHVLGSLPGPAYAVPLARFLAGDGGFGDWQTQVQSCFAAAENLDATIYVEDLGSLALERPGSPVDLGAAMAPFLESRRVRFVGEIRDDELDRFETRHRRLAGTLLRLRVESMSEAQTIEVLRRTLGQGSRRALTPESIEALVPLVSRYLPGRALPGEALRIADALIEALPAPRDAEGALPPITREELANAFAERVGIPHALVRDELPMPPAEIASALGARVIGQEQAVALVAQTLGVVKADLPPRNKPIATFLFVGPTGTGKTELARALAHYLFGSSDALARFDMSEFMDPWAAERLIRGTDREDGLLTRRARERPFSVLLLDEIEKAHPSVFDLLLQVLGEGRLTDARGKTASFTSSIVIMTSNLGARSDKPAVGFGESNAGADAERLRSERYLRAVKDHFRPELLNRIDRVVPFRRLEAHEAARIARIFVRGIQQRAGLSDGRLDLSVDDAALDHIIEGVMQGGGGARALRRTLEDTLVLGIAKLLASKPVSSATITASLSGSPRSGSIAVEHGDLVFQVLRAKKTKAASRTPLDTITHLRRRLSRWAHLSSLDTMRAEVQRLIAEVARSNRRQDPRGNDSLEHRLGVLRTKTEHIDALLATLEALEEEALACMVRDDDPSPLVPRAQKVGWDLEAAIWQALRVWDGDDESIERAVTVLHRSEQALSLFLLPLLRAKGLGTVVLHLPAGVPLPGATPPQDPWPAARAWGPALWAADALTVLLGSPRLTQPMWGSRPATVFIIVEGAAVYPMFLAVDGLLRFRHRGQDHDLLLQEPKDMPWDDAAKLPEVKGVPSRPHLLIDLDRGLFELDGSSEPIAMDDAEGEGLPPMAERDPGRWLGALHRVGLALQAALEGL